MRKVPRTTRIQASCAETSCRWPGVEDVSLHVARKEAKEHLWHTGHEVRVVITEFVTDGEEED